MNQQTCLQATGFRCEYQADVDLLFAWIGDPRPAENIEVEPGIYVRVDPITRQVIGIEVLDCADRFQLNPASIDATVAQQLLAAFSQAALAQFAAARPTPSLSRGTP